MGIDTVPTIFQRLATAVGKDYKKTTPRSDAPMPNLESDSNGEIFIQLSLELFQTSKEYRKEQFKAAVNKALELLKEPKFDATLVFKPFSLAVQTGNAELMTVAIDCMGKLFTYNFWPKMEGDLLVTEPVKSSKDAVDDFEDTLPIVAYVVDMICNSFTGETTDESVQKQITRALLSAVTSDELDYCLHGSILLKAIRTTYNIFLLSKSTDVQNQAQQTVQLMTQHVFKRIKSAKLKNYRNAARRYATSNASTMPAEITHTSVIEQIKTAEVTAPSTEVSLATEENAPSGPAKGGNISLSNVGDHSAVGQTEVPSITVTRIPSKVFKTENVSENVEKLEVATQPDNSEKYRNRFFSDAFKLIRTLLLLSIKAIPKPEGVVDLRSQPIRSKLLALHLIAAILSSHTDVFHMKAKCLMPLANIDGIDSDSFRFIHPVKESLVLLLIRNGTSVITPLFDAALQSFKILFTNSRQYLKEDLLVFFTDIVLPTLEGKDNAPWIQRHSLLKCLVELFEANGGKMLAEIYLNYDCDGKSVQENIWERLITIGSKIASNINGPVPKSNNIRLGYYVANSQFPILSTANLTCLSKEQVNEMLNHEGSSKVLGELAVRFLSIGCAKELWCWASPVKKDQPSAPPPEQPESATKKVETDDLERFENMKTAKTNAIEGIQRFNANAKTGMEFLLRRKVIAQDTPAEIANYLFNTKELEPKPLGEYLGEGEEKNVKVMYCFLEKFKFKDLQFLEALRLLLQAFRLPGEAQKIDRIMLKFAELFVMENSDVFPSADVAYILAYSVIMLNTDLHNSHVKRKMSKQEFIKNTLGIKDCKDLTEEFLTSIYDQIEANEIKMHHKKEEADTTNQHGAVDSVDRSENLAVKTEKRLRNSGNGTTVNLKINAFVYATNIEHAKPMFEILCPSLISAMTDVFQKTDIPATIKLCLDGIKYATYLGCLYELDQCKQDLLKILTEFTMHSTNRKEDPSPKGWDAINLMIKIGLSQGEKLAICWKFVIDCISRLDRLDLLRESAEPKIELHASPTTESQLPLDLMVDKIFTTSEKLCNEAILYFVGALCDVSWEEIDSVLGQPRMFCLQKLVEISYYNMNRVRLEWANIWNILGRHFNQAGCHPDMSVAIFTLDQLRQLAIKFLDLQELPNFRFQREFLQPFDLILQNTAEMKIKEMCLICIQQIFQIKGSKLKSGWKTLLSAIDNAAKETNEQLVIFAFKILSQLNEPSFKGIVENHCLADYVLCIVEFAESGSVVQINIPAMTLIRDCGTRISDIYTTAVVAVSAHASAPDEEVKKGLKLIGTDDICTRLWTPLLHGLNDLIMFASPDVRSIALENFYDTLNKQGDSFSQNYWTIISSKIIIPQFIDLTAASSPKRFEQDEDQMMWISTTATQALGKFVELFTNVICTQFLYPQLCSILKSSILFENENVSRIASKLLQQIIEKNCSRFSETDWNTTLVIFQELFQESAPRFLFFNYDETEETSNALQFPFLEQPLGPPPDKNKFKADIRFCSTHILAIQTLTDVLSLEMFFSHSPKTVAKELLNCFYKSYELAKAFNNCMELRDALYRKGYMKQLPNLQKQETLSVNAFITFQFEFYKSINDPQVLSKLFPLCLGVMEKYVELAPNESAARIVQSWRPVLSRILKGLTRLSDQHFLEFYEPFYDHIVDVAAAETSPELRQECKVCLKRIGKVHGLVTNDAIVTE